jgi:hypothetical protein
MTTNYITSDDGGVTSRPMNETETAAYEIYLASVEKEQNRLNKIEADKAKLKEATLAKLGLTADEVAALLS